MKVNVIRTGDVDSVFRLSLNGEHDDRTRAFFADNYKRFVDRAGDARDQFTAVVKNVYNYVTNVNVLDRAKRALTNVNIVTIDDKSIHYVDNRTIHNPGAVMKRYVMALPVLYNRFEKNLCSGYEDEWVNNEAGVKAELRKDYLRVIDGEVGDKSTIFYESDNPLSTRDRFIIRETWDLANHLIANGIDPTDFDEEGEI